MKIVVMLVIVSVVGCSCSKKPAYEKRADGVCFFRKGETSYKGFDIYVSHPSNKVAIKIEKKGVAVFSAQSQASIFKRWRLFTNGEFVWLYSSDVGTTAWIPPNYERIFPVDGKRVDAKKLPQWFFDSLPDRERDRWNGQNKVTK